MRSSSKLRTLATTLTAAVILVLLTVPAAAADWPKWRGPDQNGISSETGWLEMWPEGGPEVLWKASIGTGFSSMSISAGRLYAMGNSASSTDEENQMDRVLCFGAKTGKEIWRHEYPCKLMPLFYKGGPGATPTVDGDRVYTFSKEGQVFCLDAKTGKVVWSRRLQDEEGIEAPKWGFAGSVLVDSNRLIINACVGGVALEKSTGEVLWKCEEGVGGYSTPLPFEAGGNQAVAMFSFNALVAVDPATGGKLWQQPWKTAYYVNASQPIFVEDSVFISTGYGAGCALWKVEKDGLNQIWRNRNMSNQCNSSVFFDGHIYGFSGNVGGKGILRCLDLKTGDVKWSKKKLGTGSLMIADKKLIILSEDGILVIARATPEEYDELQRARILKGVCWTVPVLSNGLIYARCAEGDLVCVNPKTKKAAAPKRGR